MKTENRKLFNFEQPTDGDYQLNLLIDKSNENLY